MPWKKGQSGNPGGKVKTMESITGQLRRQMNESCRGKGFTYAQAIAKKVLSLAMEGEEWAVRVALERLDGKVKDTLALEDNRPRVLITSNAAPPRTDIGTDQQGTPTQQADGDTQPENKSSVVN